jgi:sugar-specific transcriptional regulator TrmB
MVATTETLDTLKSIGLNLYERKIFVALLAKRIATAAEVSEIAGVPRSRSYDVLESLAEKGFVMVQPSKPIKYVALAPSEALERTQENLRKKHNEMMERITKLRDSAVLNELEKIYDKGFSLIRPTEMTGTLKGRYVINRHLRSILKGAKERVYIVTTEHGLNDIYSNHLRTLKKIAKGGIALKIVAPTKDTKITSSFKEIAEIKNLENPMGRIWLIDDSALLMALTDDSTVHETQDMAFWASSPYIVQHMMNPLFDRLWGSKR